MLQMKSTCEKCQVTLGLKEVAYICSYECTFCKECTQKMKSICPNCAGRLVLRPTREKTPPQVVAGRIKKLFSFLVSK